MNGLNALCSIHNCIILKTDQIVTISISRNTDLNKAAQNYPKPEAAILLTVGSYRQLFWCTLISGQCR